MDKSGSLRFVERTEKMIEPKAVGRLYGRAEMLSRLPVSVQKRIVGRASKDGSRIGFVVEPYSFFLAYEIADEAAARRQLPPGYELLPTAMFEGTQPRLCGIVAAFNVHTSVFWGSRVEFYLIAENTTTGMLSWVICDYESNTISYDPGQGFSGSTTSHCVITTAHSGDLVVDVKSEQRDNHIACLANLEAASMRPLDQRLWLEGNLSVDYGGRLLDPESVPFGLIFDPGEVEQALHIPLGAVEVKTNTFGDGLVGREPFEACSFPFAQHFQTTSFPTSNPVRDRDSLELAVREAADGPSWAGSPLLSSLPVQREAHEPPGPPAVDRPEPGPSSRHSSRP